MKAESKAQLTEVVKLVEKARGGDQAAFGELVRRYERAVHAVSVSYLGNSPDTQDVAQETFLAVYRALPKLREPEKFGVWLYAIASRLSKNQLRKKRKKEVMFVEITENGKSEPEIADAGSQEPHEHISRRETSRELACAFAVLPEQQRAALTLFYAEKLTYREIAAFLNVSFMSVKGLIYRGLTALKEKLPGRLEE